MTLNFNPRRAKVIPSIHTSIKAQVETSVGSQDCRVHETNGQTDGWILLYLRGQLNAVDDKLSWTAIIRTAGGWMERWKMEVSHGQHCSEWCVACTFTAGRYQAIDACLRRSTTLYTRTSSSSLTSTSSSAHCSACMHNTAAEIFIDADRLCQQSHRACIQTNDCLSNPTTSLDVTRLSHATGSSQLICMMLIVMAMGSRLKMAEWKMTDRGNISWKGCIRKSVVWRI